MKPSNPIEHTSYMRRIGYCLLPVLLGAGAALVLLVVAGSPARRADAATLTFPGCALTIQGCIDNANAGDTILISAGDYTESVTLSKAVSLTGALSSTTILHALSNTRVLTVTGAAVDSSVIISGLTFAGGHALGGSCPDGCGGALLITGTAQPLLINLTISNSMADRSGGGLYADMGSPLVMSVVAVLSNTSNGNFGYMNVGGGGGAFAAGNVTLNGSLFQNNQCTGFGCFGGGLYAGSSLTATNTQFLSNTIHLELGSGGGAFANGDVTLIGSLFQGNLCGGDFTCPGGGLTARAALLSIDSNFVGNIAPDYGGGASVSGRAILQGGLFEANQCWQTGCSGAGLGAGTLLMTETQFLSNTLPWGAAGAGAYVLGPAILIGGLFQGNVCRYSCNGAGLATSQSLSMTGTQFIANSGRGGGAWVAGAATLNGGLFMSNDCGCNGGGLNVEGALSLTDTQFINNAAVANGGGAFVGGDATLQDGQFQGNLAEGIGGGLNSAAVIMTGTRFLSNTAGQGGGAYIANGTLRDGLFQGNLSGGNAGGLFVTGTLTVDGTQFQNNQCNQPACLGGGLYSSGNSLDLANVDLLSNTAQTNGGGLYADGTLAVTGTLFLGNTAQQGAGLYQNSGNGRLVNDLFAANQAGDFGDALVLASPGAVSLLHTTVASPTLGSGAAIVVVSGTVGVTDTIITSFTTGISLTGGSAFEDYNLFFGVPITVAAGVTSGGHSLAGNPAFKDPASDDYHITATSAARDTGTDAGVTIDFEGDPRPMGAGFDIGYDEFRTPIAVPDTFHGAKNTTLSVAAPGLLSNDTDFDLGPMTTTLSAGPLTGTLNLGTDGSFTYTPTLGYFGPLTFTYQASAAGISSGPGQVTIFVDRPPVAVAGAPQTTTVGLPVTLDGSGSSDPENYGPLTYGWQQSGGPAVVLSSAAISRPTFTAPGTPAVLTFTLNVTSAYGVPGGPAISTVRVTDQAIAGLGAMSGSPTVLGSATPFTATISAGTNVTYSWNFGNGAAGSGATTLHTYPALGFYPAVVTATNSLGQVTATTTVAVDDIPLAASDAYSTTENGALHVSAPGVLANDSDSFPGGLTAQLVTSPLTGTLALAPTGAFTYTPPIGFSGLVTFIYRASDGLLSSPPATVTITVNAFKVYLPLAMKH